MAFVCGQFAGDAVFLLNLMSLTLTHAHSQTFLDKRLEHQRSATQIQSA